MNKKMPKKAMIGYIYCFSNHSMPGIFKIGMTYRSPHTRLKEANKTDTWRPPGKYEIEYAIKVYNPAEKEKQLHLLLDKDGSRVDPRREFFKLPYGKMLGYFNVIDGNKHFDRRNRQKLNVWSGSIIRKV